MPRRIIFHAGFHRTGTTTLQNTLRENRVMMKKHVALRLRWHMRDLLSATRGYSTWRDPLTLIKTQERFDGLMADLPHMPKRTLIFSAEDLCGHLPGHDELADYSAAPILLYALWEIAQRHAPEAEIMIYLNTRAPESWLESAYWENVKSSRMTMDLAAFCEKYRKAADLDAVVLDIKTRVPCPVHVVALEDCKDLPFGPADPLLDLCELPYTLRTELVAQPPANQTLDQSTSRALLDANRAYADQDARITAKKAILQKVMQP